MANMRKDLAFMQKTTSEWERSNKGGYKPNAYGTIQPVVKRTLRPLSTLSTAKTFSLCLPKAAPAHVSTVLGGRQIMRISTNDSHNMKTNQGYGRKACGGFYRIL